MARNKNKKNPKKRTARRPISVDAGALSTQPIADKLLRRLESVFRQKVVDLAEIREGQEQARARHATAKTHEDLGDLHPAHAMYVETQNHVSVMSELLMGQKEARPFVELIGSAQDEYVPSAPPMSPLTTSFFSCWAFFDACVGRHEETLGTVLMAFGEAAGMDEELLGMIGRMQGSRMGVYVHEGFERNDDQTLVLRELVTERICRSICPSGYLGQKGELWYARLMPPRFPAVDRRHVVFTTPYVLRRPDETAWRQYFSRAVPGLPSRGTVLDTTLLAAFEHHMKFGPSRDCWSEFVFQGYVNHRHDVIWLRGIPDQPESLPHSPINDEPFLIG